ncbi:uncharacterized protein RSE6_13151 [Rhynchosporium secalis]|uniref:Uncharacterized protein n=1 Tax=Rhynchosporium secalis TaxID=38038 RepID=A0A1E1MS66_RHYSE|nr:uncharacterized protein RSE6_13151 [Rhynchosporium secalis]
MHFVPTILILLSAVAATQAVAARDMRIMMNMPVSSALILRSTTTKKTRILTLEFSQAPFEGNDDPAKTKCDSAGGILAVDTVNTTLAISREFASNGS